MRQAIRRSLAVTLAVLCTAAAASLSIWLLAGAAQTEDQNRDGRPDIWRSYDRYGQIARVAVDTNLDGRSDVSEFYEGAVLVRRESDRDFNDQIDLVQEFDPTTRELVRSVSDLDADGVADVLVLFRKGEPVYLTRAQGSAPLPAAARSTRPVNIAHRTNDDPLTALDDPFRRDLAVQGVRGLSTSGDSPGLSTALGISADCRSVADLPALSCTFTPSAGALSPAFAGSRSPRGPPSLHLLS